MIEQEEVRVLDINSEFLGVPPEVLMENAGQVVAKEITSRFGEGLRIAILCGTVVSGIPSGGLLGEILIITVYGFPIEALPIISMVGVLVDPPATMINAVGDNVGSMIVARVLGGPRWFEK